MLLKKSNPGRINGSRFTTVCRPHHPGLHWQVLEQLVLSIHRQVLYEAAL